jgi:ketosteroid isomerase-like protein
MYPEGWMPKADYTDHEALDPFFEIIQKGLKGLVDGEHYFDTIADNALFEFRYHFSGWPKTVRGRAKLAALYAGYGGSIKLHSADGLIVHLVQGGQVVILEYDIHGKILATGRPYENRFISVITLKNRKIVRWRDYMDSLAAWRALNGAS